MDVSNKAIAKRINKELKKRDWKQVDLLKRIIKFKNPEFTKVDVQSEAMIKKGNFSTSLKGNDNRPIPKEDLYIISKIFGVSLEYLWFGEEKKNGFIPAGARYAAYQDNDNEYRTYIAGLEYEDKVQYGDEFDFNLFDYFAQFDSINGYRFFVNNYELHFDYVQYGQLMYVNSDGNTQFCKSSDEDNLMSDKLISTLIKYNDVKTFKVIYFDNCSMGRFNPDLMYRRNKRLFGDDFLSQLVENEAFLEFALKTKTIELSKFNRHDDSNEKRTFVEPMFYEVLDYAMNHQKECRNTLLKLLKFALEYNESQYNFIKDFLEIHKDDTFGYGDVSINEYNPRFLRSYRNTIMGNIIKIKGITDDPVIDELVQEIEQYAFNMTHIINDQERNNEGIKISTPDNPLFLELHDNAVEQKADFVPFKIHSNKEFTYFQYYESTAIDFGNTSHVTFLMEFLDKAQKLVSKKENKVLVHGNLRGAKFMTINGEIVGLANWQQCHYGDKYEDRAEALSRLNDYYGFGGKYLTKYKEIFDIVSNGFTEEEQVILVDKAIKILNKQRKQISKDEHNYLDKVARSKELSSRLELFKEQYLEK